MQPSQKRNLICTIYCGTLPYAEFTFPHIKRYAEATQSALVVLDETRLAAAYPSPHFGIFEAFKLFESSAFDRMLYMDMDILILKETPNIFSSVDGPGLHARMSYSWDVIEDWVKQAGVPGL